VECSAEIRIRDETAQRAILVRHTHAAKGFVRHFQNDRTKRERLFPKWKGLSGVHQLPHWAQTRSQTAAWVKHAEVVGCEAAFFQKSYGQRVSKGKLKKRARGWCQPHGAGFSGGRENQSNLGSAGQS